MYRKNIIHNEQAAIGLPIRMVVLTIIGMIGFAVIVSAVMSTPTAPRPMYATADAYSISLTNGTGDSGYLNITISDFEGKSIGNSNVVIRDPSGTVADGAITDGFGNARMKLTNMSMPDGKQEDHISIKVMSDGYIDHHNEYFIKVIRD
ncbi:carboxypeptidase regulatory-like domain-containing protein [Methanococcoides alaskense]|uniref:Carboxypeptidase regulatory-like domain-containing protein n=1 Tax=Methanococcoides alaskense TaxID=325778 RepID=A0AA90ZBK8_9EURY|nr:carboxypeptidase regulatory-like domain-containing protein [Methanococcoides alaskense]MDA0524544.1 carboxypeptidase regulatory-like domain-containing protein [Methanococcoides alaskense]MDR6222232.1 hypothetical protein [Methanococcoides alaskense]